MAFLSLSLNSFSPQTKNGLSQNGEGLRIANLFHGEYGPKLMRVSPGPVSGPYSLTLIRGKKGEGVKAMRWSNVKILAFKWTFASTFLLRKTTCYWREGSLAAEPMEIAELCEETVSSASKQRRNHV